MICRVAVSGVSPSNLNSTSIAYQPLLPAAGPYAGENRSRIAASPAPSWWSWVVDSTVANTGGYNAYFAAERSALLGNSLSNSGAAGQIGVFRTQYFTRSVMSNNRVSGSPLTWGSA